MDPLDSLECPGCGATLPADARGCPCGYRFVHSSAPPSYATGARFEPPPPLSSSDRSPSRASGQGTFLGGLVLGFFCGCIGLAIVYMGKSHAQTKQGAIVGFATGTVLWVALRLLVLAHR